MSGASGEPKEFAFIVGAMKSGTTSLFELLAQHPQICPCREKEPDFFATEGAPSEGWERYLRLWDWDPARHEVALEASVAYAKHPWVSGVPERMAASPATSLRFIYVMRDPVERIASQVRHGLYDGWGTSLDEGITEDLIDFSRYAAQMDRYTAVFPRDRILLLTLDEMNASPEAVLRRVCEFLGVDPDHSFAGLEEPRNAGSFYTVPGWMAALARNPVAGRVVAGVLPRGARSRLRGWLSRFAKGDAAEIGRWRLNEGEVAQVRARLADDMARLRDHYGVRAPWLPAAATPGGSA